MKARTFSRSDLCAVVCGAAVFLVAITVPAAPSAARADQVDQLIDQGVSLRLQGHPEEALDLFARAHALAPSARTLAQIGLAEGALHHWIASENHLAAALASHDTPWIDVPRNREALEQALATVRSHVGTLKVVGPPGVRLDVDGREVGRLPLTSPLRLPEGPAHVTATTQGDETTQVVVTIVGGAEQTIVLPAAPLAQLPAAPAALHLDEQPPAARWKTWTGIGLLAASAGTIAAGAVWLFLDGRPSCPAGQVTRCEMAYDTKLQGWLAIGAGIAAGSAGGILLWSARQASATVAAGPGTIAFTGRF